MSSVSERVIITDIHSLQRNYRLKDHTLYIKHGVYKFYINTIFEVRPAEGILLEKKNSFIRVKFNVRRNTKFTVQGDVYFNDYKIHLIQMVTDSTDSWKSIEKTLVEYENNVCAYCGKESSHTTNCHRNLKKK